MSIGALTSFHYWRRAVPYFGAWKPLVFADSGAFSAHNAGAAIDVDEYARWLDLHRSRIDIACTLDVIGDAEATARNTRILEAHGHRVVPVFHVGEEWRWLDEYCDRYPYVALGGMVGHKKAQGALLRWLLECLERGANTGTRFHAFGITTMRTVADLPLFSADSTTWNNGQKYGELPLWDDMRGVVRIRTFHRGEHVELLESYGCPIPDIIDPSYGRVVDGKTEEQKKREYAELSRAVLESWRRFERWWHARVGPVTLEGLPDGPHVFLAFNPADLETVKRNNLEEPCLE